MLAQISEIHHDSFDEEWLHEVDLDQPDSLPTTSMPSSRTGGHLVRAARTILVKTHEQTCFSPTTADYDDNIHVHTCTLSMPLKDMCAYAQLSIPHS